MSDNKMTILAVGEKNDEWIFPVVDPKAIHFNGPQELTPEEQAQVKANLGINLFAYNFTTICEAPKEGDFGADYDSYSSPQDAEAIDRIVHNWQKEPMSVYIKGYPVIGADINNHHLKVLYNDRYIYTFNWWVDSKLENISIWPHAVAKITYEDEVKKYIDTQDASAVRYTPQSPTPEQQAIARANMGITGTGLNGKDGVSVTHSWDGTVLTITSASGTSSVDLEGAPGPEGPQGPQGVVGPEGPAGADGKTPVKGTDYFTAADKAEMVNAVIAALPVYDGEVV